MRSFDVAVIGAGPGGYFAAIRSAQLGKKVAIIEKEPKLGGTCLRVGCIPSKALLESSELFHKASHSMENHGIVVSKPTINLSAMMSRKDSIVNELTTGVGLLMRKNKITVLEGFGKIVAKDQIAVKGHDVDETIQASSIVIATGSTPIELPHVPFDHDRIVDSTGALSFPEIPKKMLVIGGGAIGLEMGSVWSRLGAEVTVVELLPRITPFADVQAGRALFKSLQSQGLNFMLETKLAGAEVKGDQVHATLELKDGSTQEFIADRMLVSVGRRAYADGLGVDSVGIEVDKRGKVQVDGSFRTAVPNIYAIGDVVDGPMLAHKAEEEGVLAAEIIAGKLSHSIEFHVPNVVYTEPELAMVGITEEQAKEEKRDYKVGRFSFKSNARAKTMDSTDGFVKFVADKKTDRILGAHIVGPHASELIGEIVLAMEYQASLQDITVTNHAHPTLSEVVKEAALAVDRRAING